jgi:excisionase family DNA binding protein
MAEIDDHWLSEDEIGTYLGVSSDTVYRWIDKHAMGGHRMSRLWKFKKDQVDAWVEVGGAADRKKKGSDEWRLSTTSILCWATIWRLPSTPRPN